MKVIAYSEFGSSDKLYICEKEDPKPGVKEVLVQIAYAAVNPVDRKFREGQLVGLVPHKFPITPGWDLSGTVIAVGSEVHDFRVGDEVYSYVRLAEIHDGCYAEKISVPAAMLAPKPKNLNLAEAASVPLVALTAYQALMEVCHLSSKDRVFINGGAGGVGAYAVQLARIVKAKCTATTSTSNLSYVQELGALNIIDYTKEDVVEESKKIAPEGFDVILDCVGGESLEKLRAIKHSQSRVVSIVQTSDFANFHFVYPNSEQLKIITSYFEAGSLMNPLITLFNIKDAALAQDENAKGRGRGKLVLEILF